MTEGSARLIIADIVAVNKGLSSKSRDKDELLESLNFVISANDEYKITAYLDEKNHITISTKRRGNSMSWCSSGCSCCGYVVLKNSEETERIVDVLKYFLGQAGRPREQAE